LWWRSPVVRTESCKAFMGRSVLSRAGFTGGGLPKRAAPFSSAENVAFFACLQTVVLLQRFEQEPRSGRALRIPLVVARMEVDAIAPRAERRADGGAVAQLR